MSRKGILSLAGSLVHKYLPSLLVIRDPKAVNYLHKAEFSSFASRYYQF